MTRTTKSGRFVFLVALIFGLSALFIPSSVVAAENEVIIGMASGLRKLDPHDDVATHATSVKRNIYETLTTRDKNMQLIPHLAVRWEPAGEKTWRFFLRKGVKFHNGEPLSARDVKFSLDRVNDNKLALHGRTFTKTIRKVDIVDEHTVDVTTSVSDPVLPARMAFCAFIMPKKTVEAMGLEAFNKKPVGTGPYLFVEWVKDSRIVLKKNPAYWGKPPKNNRVVFKPIPENSTRFAALETGEVDVAVGIPPHLVPRLKANKNLRVESVRSGRNVFIILNKNKKPFDNKLVRQALNYAVDVPTIIKYLFGGAAHQVTTIGSPAVFGYSEKPDRYAYNEEKARQLLAKAGYPKGFKTTLAVAIGRPFASQDIGQAIAQYLRRVGVDVKLETMDWGEYIPQWRKGKHPMYYMGFGTPVLDLDDFIGGYFDPKRRATWGHPPQKAIDLGYRALQEFNPEKRKQIYGQYVELIQEDAQFIFLFNFDDIYGLSKNVKGFKARPDEQVIVTNLSKE